MFSYKHDPLPENNPKSKKKFLEFFMEIRVFMIKENIMKRIIRLTESDLTRIVKRVIKEQSSTEEGRNNPQWVNLVSKLKTLSYPPKVLTFNSYDTPSVPSQSLNWGTAKGSNGKYALTIGSTDFKMPKERMSLFNSDDRKNQMEMHNWWKKRGYSTNGSDISISFNDADKLRGDLETFFKMYPPQ